MISYSTVIHYIVHVICDFLKQNAWYAFYVSAAFYGFILFLREDLRRKPVIFLPVFYSVLVLFQTLRGRYWPNPLIYLWNGWGFYNMNGELSCEGLLNVIMFVPFGFLLPTLKKLSLKWVSIYSFLFSLAIETTQLVFHRGTFQFADLTYNTLGGVIGGACYLVLHRIVAFLCRNRRKTL